jgi:superfamily II DNA/RNA helicase
MWKKTQIWFALAQTGDRKTAAFGFPVIKIDANKQEYSSINFISTRELCLQITNKIKTTLNTKRC